MAIKIDYDSENDIAYFYADENFVDYSIDYDDIVLDVSGKRITGIEIIDVSKFLNIDNANKIKKFFSSVKNVAMKVEYKQNSISIRINLEDGKSKENLHIRVPVRKDLVV